MKIPDWVIPVALLVGAVVLVLCLLQPAFCYLIPMGVLAYFYLRAAHRERQVRREIKRAFAFLDKKSRVS